MTHVAKFTYQTRPNGSIMPIIPVQLERDGKTVQAQALLDTGSSVNVLPYRLGLELGLDWNEQQATIRLTGGLAESTSMRAHAKCTVGDFEALRLVFAWTRDERAPLIFGQADFFYEFDAYFSRFNQVLTLTRSRGAS